jgi:hypothetical protein
LGIVSCRNDGRPPLIPVQGQVFLDSKPAYKAVVWFHPIEACPPGTPLPRGVVDQDGSFAAGTYKSKDGIPAGKYRIAIYWKRAAKSGDQDGESLIPIRYTDPAQSGLPVIEVDQEPITLPAFRLTSN